MNKVTKLLLTMLLTFGVAVCMIYVFIFATVQESEKLESMSYPQCQLRRN